MKSSLGRRKLLPCKTTVVAVMKSRDGRLRKMFTGAFQNKNLSIMIPYSITMLGNPSDAGKPKKAYARAQFSNVMTLDDFAGHISDHNNVYDKGDVYAVLTKAVSC